MVTPPRKPVSAVDAALDRVRAICLAFPGAEEKLSHGAPSFHVRGRMFLMFVDDHHRDGRLAVWCKSAPAEQQSLVATDSARFFVPPYVGVKGWVGVRLDSPEADYIGLAILAEEGWLSVAPKRLAQGQPTRVQASRRPPTRPTTDAGVARVGFEKLSAICLALPEATREGASRHAAFRVRKKTFAYFLDNHHGDGIVAACVKAERAKVAALVAADPKGLYLPAYIGARGWIGVRLDTKRVDWDAVAERVVLSYRGVAPKRLAALATSPSRVPALATSSRSAVGPGRRRRGGPARS
jgi:hypothetical protein